MRLRLNCRTAAIPIRAPVTKERGQGEVTQVDRQLNRMLERIGQMALSLSRTFQLALNTGQELTNVKKKLLHVEQYLSFQQRCCDNLFDYRIALSLARAA